MAVLFCCELIDEIIVQRTSCSETMSVPSLLQDADFPVAPFEDQPLDHPRIRVLRRLAREHAEAFRHGTAPEKWRIVDQIVAEVKPGEGGCCRWKMKDGTGWKQASNSCTREVAVVENSVTNTLFAVANSDSERVIPASDDILCGRGKHSVHHHGNKQFRIRCSKVETTYNRTLRTSEKQAIVKQLYSDFESGGHRFLKFNGLAGTWAIMPRKAALYKIRQCIKDSGKAGRRGGYISSGSSFSSTFTVSDYKVHGLLNSIPLLTSIVFLKNPSSRSRVSSVYSGASRASLPSSLCKLPNANAQMKSPDRHFDDGSMTSNISEITGGTTHISYRQTSHSITCQEDLELEPVSTNLALKSDSSASSIAEINKLSLPSLTARPELNDPSETSTWCSSVDITSVGATSYDISRSSVSIQESAQSDAAVRASQYSDDMIDKRDDLVGIVVRINWVSEADISDTSSTSTSGSVLSMLDKLDLEEFEPSSPIDTSKDWRDLEALFGQDTQTFA